MTTSVRNVLFTTTAVALGALLAGCATAAPAVTPDASGERSGSAEPGAPDPAGAAVSDYLDAIAFGNVAGAWELLSAETQATYDDSAQTYAAKEPTDETVTAEEARAFVATDFVISIGPGFRLVSARSGDLADAWVVRDSGDGPRIDDPGIAATRERPYAWTNPDDTAFDTTRPPTICFRAGFGSAGESDGDSDTGGELSARPPASVVGFADGVQVPVTRSAPAGTAESGDTGAAGDSGGSPVEFVADVPAGTSVLTVVWAPDPGSPLWQSSTVALD